MKARFTLLALLLLVLLSGIMGVVSAQVRPAMTVYTRWTPQRQLTSLGADERFATLNIYVDGNVSFWATSIKCTVGKGTELLINDDLTDVSFGSEWGTLGTGFVATPGNASGDYYSGNILAFTASRVGTNNTPMGINGQDYTQLIASVRFEVQPLIANTNVTVACSVMDFLDRDGNIVIKGRYSKLLDLNLLTGYSLTGTALRQGTRAHQNIQVTCTQDDDRNFSTVGDQTNYGPVNTTATGAFSFSAATLLRDFGAYRCRFVSAFAGTPNGQILTSEVYFDLQTPTYTLLPIVLRGGDVQESNTIELSDITLITGAFNTTTTAYGAGDTNGDAKVDQLDLAITTGNFSLAGNYVHDHIIYGLGRDLDPAREFPNSKMWWGSSENGAVTALNSRSTTRDFWPQLSPDGTTIAYVFADTRTGFHNLATLTVAGARSTTLTFPRGWTREAFAPSWSPDGQMLAFVCAVEADYVRNRGDICLVNNGDRTGTSLYNLGVSSDIFPPTWLSYDNGGAAGYVLLYAGTDGLLHFYNLATGASGILPIDNGGADVIDMPVVVNYIHDGTPYLAYRFSANGTDYPYIKIGTISYDGTNFTGGVVGAVNGVTHVALSPLTNLVDYFDIAPNLDILFYREYVETDGDLNFYYLDHNDAAPLAWSAPVTHRVDSAIGNPITDLAGGGVWNGDFNRPTELHIHRMTFDVVP